uniref:DUF6221 family protein n=1 Tax=Streptomyces sp. CA-141956 TaxID=3240051 RepID=UPI003F498919
MGTVRAGCGALRGGGRRPGDRAGLTGRGPVADEEVTFHVLRNQPSRTLDDLDAKDDLLDLLDQSADGPLAERLLDIVQKFAAPFHDHPDFPEEL